VVEWGGGRIDGGEKEMAEKGEDLLGCCQRQPTRKAVFRLRQSLHRKYIKLAKNSCIMITISGGTNLCIQLLTQIKSRAL